MIFYSYYCYFQIIVTVKITTQKILLLKKIRIGLFCSDCRFPPLIVPPQISSDHLTKKIVLLLLVVFSACDLHTSILDRATTMGKSSW